MWGRAGDFSLDEWHNFLSLLIWGVTFALMVAVPVKRVRRWNVLALGLTAISAILAYLLITASVSMLWPTVETPGARPLFRDFGSLVNIVIIVFLIRHTKEDDL